MVGKGHCSHAALERLGFLGNRKLEGGQNAHLLTDADCWQEGGEEGSIAQTQGQQRLPG